MTALNRRQFVAGAAATAAASAFAAGTAVADEAAEAPANPAWLGEAPAITDADCVETMDCDVLVIGAGCSGLFAANFAAQEGVKTILIEKYPAGAGVRGSGMGGVNTHKHQEQGIYIDPNEIANDFVSYALNNNSYDLIRLWTDNSAEAIKWYCDTVEGIDDVRVDLEWNMPEQETRYKCWPTGHGSMRDDGESVGKDDASAEGITYRLITEKFAAHENAELIFNLGMDCLIKEDGKVVGAYCSYTETGEKVRINAAKGVIVATGGYSCNPDMIYAIHGESVKSLVGLVPWSFFNCQGDGIKACLWAGAVKDAIPTMMIFDRGIMRPDQEIGHPYDFDFDYLHFATQPFLKVDAKGERITNESSPYDYLVHAAAQRPGRSWHVIWDANWPTDIDRFHTIGCSTLIKREGTNQMDPEGIDGTAEILDGWVEKGYVVKADTLEELAEAFGFDTETFLANVEEYNGFYDNQCDERYGKEPFRLSELRTAPFYGVRIGGLMLCTLDGIKINTKFQALDADNNPIEGLYCIGNDSGNYYGGTYPNLAAGANAGRCVTFGMLCGRQVAQL